MLRDAAGAVVAFCVCWVIFDELHINTLAVKPADRRVGLATTLLREVMAEAAAAGAKNATLEVRASNTAALGLYTRLGFHVAAKRPRYYTQPEEDALILWREGFDDLSLKAHSACGSLRVCTSSGRTPSTRRRKCRQTSKR